MGYRRNREDEKKNNKLSKIFSEIDKKKYKRKSKIIEKWDLEKDY